MRHGKGRWKINNDDQVLSYQGMFSNNHFEGKGRLTTYYEDGTKDIYEGTWEESLRSGKGIERYANGEVYKGDFKEGLYNGKGTYTWANGSKYEGQYKNGEKHGEGKWVIIDGEPEHANSATDRGKPIAENRKVSTYTGEFENGFKSGFGINIWSTGGRYDGQFLFNKRHG